MRDGGLGIYTLPCLRRQDEGQDQSGHRTEEFFPIMSVMSP